MRTWKHPLTVYMDRKGNLEIEDITHGSTESDQIADELDITLFVPLDITVQSVRAEGLDAEQRQRIREWTQLNEHTLVETEDLGAATWSNPEGLKPHPTTIDAVYEHTLEPTLKEKVLVPVVIIALIAVAFGVGSLVYDHTNLSYRTAAGLGDVVLYAQADLPERGGLAGFLDPADDAFVAVKLRSWDYWAGRGAVTGGHYLYLPGLERPVESLVKDDRGGASTVTVKFDVSRAEPPRYHVTEIVRGSEVLASDLTAEILRVPGVTTPPAGYLSDRAVNAGSPATWNQLERIQATGYLFPVENGYRLRSRDYTLELPRPENALLARMLGEAVLTPEEQGLYDEAMAPKPKVSLPAAKLVRLYVDLVPGSGGDEVQARGDIHAAQFGDIWILD